MLDYRIHTFITLCELMNYRKTAEKLNMTQPAVTQHIQFLEKEYQCKLFEYNCKKLSKTSKGKNLELYARSAYYNDLNFRDYIGKTSIEKIRIGATKTIGDYLISDKIINLLKRNDIEISLDIDNTQSLLHKLNNLELDITLIEGYFDKINYDYQLIKTEELVGICAKDHIFSGKEVTIESLFSQKLIMREVGSGTKEVFEKTLLKYNYSLDFFPYKSYIASFNLIKKAVLNHCGIAFVYAVIPQSDSSLGTFTLKNIDMIHEYNYVYLKNTNAGKFVSLFDENK